MTARRTLVLALACVALALAATAAHGEPASFRSWVESLPEAEQRAAQRRLDGMPSARRERLFQRWDSLDTGERSALQERLRGRLDAGERPRTRFESMPPERREKLGPLVRRWRGMEPAERRRMRQRLERFGDLSAAQQEAMIEKRFQAKSPQERARILESLREASGELPRRPTD